MLTDLDPRKVSVFISAGSSAIVQITKPTDYPSITKHMTLNCIGVIIMNSLYPYYNIPTSTTVTITMLTVALYYTNT